MTPDYGKLAYEKYAEANFFSHPRLQMRTATWDELSEKIQEDWRNLAKYVINAFLKEITLPE